MSEIQNILFITASRIGDAVLTTGLLDYMARSYPESKVTIVCGPLCTSLFDGYPSVAEIIPLKKKSWNRHWLALWNKTIETHWDVVVDMRNSIVSRTIFARERYIYGKHIPAPLHKVEQAGAVMKLNHVPEPKLWFTPEQKKKAKALIPDGDPVLGIGPTANWIGKTWPNDRFIEVMNFLTGKSGPMKGARIAVFGAPGEEEDARRVLSAVPEGRGLDIIAKTDPGTAAACLARCGFYLGNDSGLMHCAAATGTPTFGLFGPSYPEKYAPWGAHAAYARTPESFDELIDFEGYNPKTLTHTLMESLSVDMVIEDLKEFFDKKKIAA